MVDLGSVFVQEEYPEQGVIAIIALAVNVLVLAVIIKRSVELKRNPYKQEVWKGDADFEEAMARAEA